MTAPSIFTEVHTSELHSVLRNPQASFALACWHMAAGGSLVPEEADFIRQAIASARPDMMILRRLPDGDLLYEHYGSSIISHSGFDMTGKHVSEFGGALKTFYLDVYEQAITGQKPIATLHRLGHFKERPLWERIILPVAKDGVITALYVINTVRELQYDVNHLKVRSRGNGLIVLQFERDEKGHVTDARIVGANQAAVDMTDKRLDQMLDRPMAECFPGIHAAGLWQRYLDVAQTRTAQEFPLNYTQDGLEGIFQVIIAPFLDGVSVEFSLES